MPCSRLPTFRSLPLFLAAAWLAACAPSATKTDPGGGGAGGGAGRAGTGGSGGTPGGGQGGAPGDGGGMTGGAGGGNPGAPATIPMTVTREFPNQGWFGDPSVAAHFASGSMVIRQTDGTTGPCATRGVGARGKCLKIIYTPPPNLTPPPTGGWVGVFFLTTLLNQHPELMPAANAGDANWGAEPGRTVAAGATKISFSAASDVAGATVIFKAGVDKDSFVMPEQPEVLGTTWKTYSMPLPASGYGSAVLGGFAWVLKNTTQATTFYLDNIVWE